MNGAHDMGGMEGFGPINAEPEATEPVFHAAWEGRVYGMNRALGALGQWNIDIGRSARERQLPADYLRHTYYENWFAGIQTLLVESGLVTQAELDSGVPAAMIPQDLKSRVLTAEVASRVPNRLGEVLMPDAAPPRFATGDRVLAKNRHPHGHTREPRYLRGHVGVVHEHYGTQLFPDAKTAGDHRGGHLYCVRFEAQELWGESANAQSAVYADLWEEYLEQAS
jgi:nitrile hydratase subunit beta